MSLSLSKGFITSYLIIIKIHTSVRTMSIISVGRVHRAVGQAMAIAGEIDDIEESHGLSMILDRQFGEEIL